MVRSGGKIARQQLNINFVWELECWKLNHAPRMEAYHLASSPEVNQASACNHTYPTACYGESRRAAWTGKFSLWFQYVRGAMHTVSTIIENRMDRPGP